MSKRVAEDSAHLSVPLLREEEVAHVVRCKIVARDMRAGLRRQAERRGAKQRPAHHVHAPQPGQHPRHDSGLLPALHRVQHNSSKSLQQSLSNTPTITPQSSTLQFFAVKLLPGDLGANSLAVLYVQSPS